MELRTQKSLVDSSHEVILCNPPISQGILKNEFWNDSATDGLIELGVSGEVSAWLAIGNRRVQCVGTNKFDGFVFGFTGSSGLEHQPVMECREF